jgi:hypothetical protein
MLQSPVLLLLPPPLLLLSYSSFFLLSRTSFCFFFVFILILFSYTVIPGSELEFVDETHPIVYIAKYSHASYISPPSEHLIRMPWYGRWVIWLYSWGRIFEASASDATADVIEETDEQLEVQVRRGHVWRPWER